MQNGGEEGVKEKEVLDAMLQEATSLLGEKEISRKKKKG